ncbi:MAG: O-antigen ligase family protein, partial [Ginsengibacter sp.]
VFLISFLSFSGYYIGLALIISFGDVQISRYYSVPFRLLLLVIMILLIIRNRQKLRRHLKGIYFPLMFLFAILYIFKVLFTQIGNNPLSRNWYEYIFYFLGYSFIPFLAYSTINFAKFKEEIIGGILLSGFILGCLSLYLYKDILIMGIGRISEIKYQLSNVQTLSPLALSYSGVLTIILCVYKLIFTTVKSMKYKLYLFTNIILSFIMFFLGATRGSLVVLLLSLPFLFYFSSYRNKKKLFLLLIIIIPFVIYGATVTKSAIFSRTENSLQTGDASGRQPLWTAAFREFKNNPFVGGRIEVSGIYPHNIFLEVLMSTGILGFILFGTVLYGSVKRGLNLVKANTAYMVPLLILINGITQYFFSGSVYDAIFLFVPMGLIFSSKKSQII